MMGTLAIAAMMVSCNNSNPKMDEQPAQAESLADDSVQFCKGQESGVTEEE